MVLARGTFVSFVTELSGESVHVNIHGLLAHFVHCFEDYTLVKIFVRHVLASVFSKKLLWNSSFECPCCHIAFSVSSIFVKIMPWAFSCTCLS
jgi:hypothetical protein